MSNLLRLRWAGLLCWLLIVSVCLSAEGKKKKAPEPFCSLSFVVLRESDGTPIKNASVVLHFLRQDGSQEWDGLQLKTNADGRASIEDIPYGKLRLQVVAHSLQTYGDDVEVNQAKQEFVIRLKPPAAQVSIYK
jgi:5-hydroxyisourate hydrolase-like protein (transthyretin family)